MAYSELVKSFERIRSYMREFYVYGFRTREEFSAKSARSYDNERRRLESILGEYTLSNRAASGKSVYLSIDSRSGSSDPLFRLFKACSFTDREITLHFMLFDMLKTDKPMLLCDILQRLEDYTASFAEPMQFDESGVRKTLAEYERAGLVHTKKQGRQVSYYRSEESDLSEYADALELFSEVGACGVIGSFIRDKLQEIDSVFEFKHHYITHTLDSEVLYRLLSAISEKRLVTIEHHPAREGSQHTWRVLPLKIFVSVQNGRRWVLAYSFDIHQIKAYRLDYLGNVIQGEVCPHFDEIRGVLDKMQQQMWGVSCGKSMQTEHVEFIVYIGDGEEHIYRRLLREKRCGSVERVDEHTVRFTAEVRDTGEMIPWIRTFIGRIIQLDLSNRTLENRLRRDIYDMYSMYGVGGDEDAVP